MLDLSQIIAEAGARAVHPAGSRIQRLGDRRFFAGRALHFHWQTFPQLIRVSRGPLRVPTLANSRRRPRVDILASNRALMPFFAANRPYRSNGEPAGIAWRGCCDGASRVGHNPSQCQLLQTRGAGRGRTFPQAIRRWYPYSPKIRHTGATVSLWESRGEAAAKAFREFSMPSRAQGRGKRSRAREVIRRSAGG